ncbi:MAG: DUF1501 domain-containing protein [Planctomycetes bacterium]|nr:DUF1501 domain-containing protein [Planctomycetota bacterium]
MQTTRRQFLIGGLAVTAAVPLASRSANALGEPGAFGSRGDADERVLVVLQLSGGNDALNMVVPGRQDAYFKLRPTLALARGSLHRLDDDFGLHPSMGALAPLFADGRASLVHGVGYPQPNRSHFRSMEIWHTADPEHPPGTQGWMGRIADELAERAPGSLVALHIGDGDLPLALRAEKSFTPTLRGKNGLELRASAGPTRVARDGLLARDGRGELAFLRSAARTTYAAAERMGAIASRASKSDYPNSRLAERLALVAKLVAGGFGTRLFHVELAGFDTHSRQAPVHAALLGELSGALAAFQQDLDAQGVGSRVTTMVFSEFGRRVEENGSKGTDHGAAAPVLFVGRTLRPGLHGTPPDLEALVEGDVPFTTDFRALYAALERDWLGVKPSTKTKPLTLFA